MKLSIEDYDILMRYPEVWSQVRGGYFRALEMSTVREICAVYTKYHGDSPNLTCGYCVLGAFRALLRDIGEFTAPVPETPPEAQETPKKRKRKK